MSSPEGNCIGPRRLITAMTYKQFYPTCAFGFSPINGEQRLHQLWFSEDGELSWRPVPYLELKQRNPSIAGYVEDEDVKDD